MRSDPTKYPWEKSDSQTQHPLEISAPTRFNGNGRTARIWANWLAVRYGLPPFVRLMPRPDDVLFAGAAEMSMRGDHRPTEAMFAVMLCDALVAAVTGP